MDELYTESSYGKAWLSGRVLGPYMLDADYSRADVGTLTDAAMEAVDDFVDFTGYNRVSCLSPRQAIQDNEANPAMMHVIRESTYE